MNLSVYDASRRHNYEEFKDVCETVQSHYGTGGNNVPLVVNSCEKKDQPIMFDLLNLNPKEDGISQTLNAYSGTGGNNMPMIYESIAIESHPKDSRYQIVSPETNQCIPSIMCHDAAHGGLIMEKNINESYQNITGTSNQLANNDMFVANHSVVRRLTPLECERLQGYPDGWTDIGDWVDSKGKKHKGDADSPRYKALGNSIALPFWEWMAERIADVLREEGNENPTMASLFDGIGGFPLVFSRCGVEPIWAS